MAEGSGLTTSGYGNSTFDQPPVASLRVRRANDRVNDGEGNNSAVTSGTLLLRPEMAGGDQHPVIRDSAISEATSGYENSDLFAGVNPLGQERGVSVRRRRDREENLLEYENTASGSYVEMEEEGEREYDEVGHGEGEARLDVKLVRNQAYGMKITS